MNTAATGKKHLQRAVCVLSYLLVFVLGGVCAWGLHFKTAFEVSWHTYHYETADGAFSDFETPAKGRSYDLVQRSFRRYKEKSPGEAVELRRTFEPGVWHHIDSLFHGRHPRWSLEYQAPASPDPPEGRRPE